MFAVGALLPLIPWFWWHGNGAVVASVIIGALAAIGVGAGLSAFTLQTWWRSAARQLTMTAVAAAVTFGIGSAIGVGIH